MITKTSIAVDLWKSGDRAKALSIFKTFRLGVTKEEKATLEMAHEIATGRAAFYTSLGYDTALISTQAEELVDRLFLKPVEA